jgi:glycosyltransferase involved in cell wall biosynthesis
VNVGDFEVSADEVSRAKEEYGIRGKVSVLFAGNVIPLKGVHHLVKAAEIILKCHKDVVFLIAGNLEIDKRFSKFIVDYVNTRGLNNNIKVLGFVPHRQLRVLYAACDIFVLPSLEEGQSIALLEAMASGKPLIGSNAGGIPMQIRDGWNGFLVEPENEKRLAEKIQYLIENEGERMRMGDNSRKLAKDKFSWEKIVEEYLKVYEEVCHRRR